MFGQLAGRSVFNTPTGYHPNSSHFRSTICKRRRHTIGVRATPSLHPPFFWPRKRHVLAARVLAIVHAWSAWRALQRCIPHRRQRSSSLACSLLRPEGHLSEVYVVKQKKYVRGGASATRPALPRQSSASGREIAEKGRLAGHIGLVFHIAVSPPVPFGHRVGVV